MMERFKSGNLSVEGFDRDDEIEVVINGWEFDQKEYISRTKAIELRDWLTKQIDAKVAT